jgi:hypothetical protein
MIDKKYFHVIFAFLMALMMSFLMSGFITLVNIGFVEDFFARWLMHAFPIAFAIAFPVALFVVPVVRKLVGKIVKE